MTKKFIIKVLWVLFSLMIFRFVVRFVDAVFINP